MFQPGQLAPARKVYLVKSLAPFHSLGSRDCVVTHARLSKLFPRNLFNQRNVFLFIVKKDAVATMGSPAREGTRRHILQGWAGCCHSRSKEERRHGLLWRHAGCLQVRKPLYYLAFHKARRSLQDLALVNPRNPQMSSSECLNLGSANVVMSVLVPFKD